MLNCRGSMHFCMEGAGSLILAKCASEYGDAQPIAE